MTEYCLAFRWVGQRQATVTSQRNRRHDVTLLPDELGCVSVCMVPDRITQDQQEYNPICRW